MLHCGTTLGTWSFLTLKTYGSNGSASGDMRALDRYDNYLKVRCRSLVKSKGLCERRLSNTEAEQWQLRKLQKQATLYQYSTRSCGVPRGTNTSPD